jgi:hypothetical protein
VVDARPTHMRLTTDVIKHTNEHVTCSRPICDSRYTHLNARINDEPSSEPSETEATHRLRMRVVDVSRHFRVVLMAVCRSFVCLGVSTVSRIWIDCKSHVHSCHHHHRRFGQIQERLIAIIGAIIGLVCSGSEHIFDVCLSLCSV